MARILLIDDDDALREILAVVLTRSGHAVTQANTGKKGVALFLAEPADLVITDLIMPDQEGIETIVQLRREHPDVAIIAMSGGVSNSGMYLNLAAKLGAQRVLGKPFTMTELLNTVTEVLPKASG